MKNDPIKPMAYGRLNWLTRTLTVIICLVYLLLTFSKIMAQGASLPEHSDAIDSLTFVDLLEDLKRQPQNVNLLVKASKLAGTLGGRADEGKVKDRLIDQAKCYATRAINLERSNVDAHFCLIIALGLASENASSAKERLKNARFIKSEADLILRLNPNHAGAYYVLGKWHLGLSNLSPLEKVFCNTFLGGLPEGASQASAQLNFQRAVRLQPDFILFHYGLAQALASEGDNARARQVLEHALQLPVREADDFVRKNNCLRLLKKINPTAI
jgi:regulator of microtubule dynamics protein 3